MDGSMEGKKNVRKEGGTMDGWMDVCKKERRKWSKDG